MLHSPLTLTAVICAKNSALGTVNGYHLTSDDRVNKKQPVIFASRQQKGGICGIRIKKIM